ncbi:MAG: nucleotidyltransferase, partial [Terracidiphilus sp.]
AVDDGVGAPVRGVQARLTPLIARWAGASLVDIFPSGSFAKGTGNRSGTDIDLFLSLREETDWSLGEIYDGLDRMLRAAGFAVRRQNVSLNVKVNGCSVDLVPGKRQNRLTGDHSLYLRRRDTWIKTNVKKHVQWVGRTGRRAEMRLMKLWRDQRGLDWPSFYVELGTARALEEQILPGTLSGNLRRVLEFARDRVERARLVDPANGNNVVSDTLTGEEKRLIARAAAAALKETDWRRMVR